jgi:hypothetical protein
MSNNKKLIDKCLLAMKETGETFKTIAGRSEGMTEDIVKHHYYGHMENNNKSAAFGPDAKGKFGLKKEAIDRGLEALNSEDQECRIRATSEILEALAEDSDSYEALSLEEMLKQAHEMYSRVAAMNDPNTALRAANVVIGILEQIQKRDELAVRKGELNKDDNLEVQLVWADELNAKQRGANLYQKPAPETAINLNPPKQTDCPIESHEKASSDDFYINEAGLKIYRHNGPAGEGGPIQPTKADLDKYRKMAHGVRDLEGARLEPTAKEGIIKVDDTTYETVPDGKRFKTWEKEFGKNYDISCYTSPDPAFMSALGYAPAPRDQGPTVEHIRKKIAAMQGRV